LLPGSRRLGGATGSEASEDRFLSRFAESGQQVARTTQYVHDNLKCSTVFLKRR
jgi:hypothetical protein